ncbi:MAG TPA: biotin transporter BioY [Candidatus Hydrogenedentes bacterium]|nr:biotin transporter BioY [Candidatus Hydrogenedentota bacterium]HRK34297.1 biotin transporter BioY [Candidatus Hydrogenedentota bacterium]
MRNSDVHILQHARPVDNPFFGIIEVLAVAGAVFLAAQIKIWLYWTPVPLTLQTLPVLAAAYVVGRDRAAMGIGLYLTLGAVFSMFEASGVSIFAAPFGATTGFLIAFAIVPFVCGAIKRPALAIATATLVLYAVGMTWFCFWAGVGPVEAFTMAIAPFIIGDIAKGIVAYLVARRAQRQPETAQA